MLRSQAVRSRGAVNIEEAVEAVQAGRGHHAPGPTTAPSSGSQPAGSPQQAAGEQEQQQGRQRQTVAVDADRGSFERLLLMPDMLNDHLPDSYVSALQQL